MCCRASCVAAALAQPRRQSDSRTRPRQSFPVFGKYMRRELESYGPAFRHAQHREEAYQSKAATNAITPCTEAGTSRLGQHATAISQSELTTRVQLESLASDTSHANQAQTLTPPHRTCSLKDATKPQSRSLSDTCMACTNLQCEVRDD